MAAISQRTTERPYRVQFYENCDDSPASWLVPHAISELEEKGLPDPAPALRFTRTLRGSHR